MPQGGQKQMWRGSWESYDLRVRATSHHGVSLCATCRAPVERELDGE